ncbi:MAG: site-specific integrase [SAR86 cluster bacterium]|uniref:Site-specific integrase n=1 Tax=SAR86 cluster bacterium TaxID=2030880 RepID=A0A2A5ATS6_9GAMM|nr:MAG: site-specific integrase [SAR86 cluster bacterium]
MADIRKRQGKKGVTYQVRYPNASTKTGYAFKTFRTMKEARAFSENSIEWNGSPQSAIKTVSQAVDLWMDVCEMEGTDGHEPVTKYTLKTYQYRADRIKAYGWDKELSEITTPDIVIFRTWLAQTYTQDQARKTLSSFHTVLKEMTLRGYMGSNPATGISIKSSSRYDVPVEIPTPKEIHALLAAADRLANSSNRRTAKTWLRYRPMLYLAVDSGMRPQEYLALPKSNIKSAGVQVTQAIERGGYKISVTKTKAGRRFIDLSDEVLELINDYAANHAAISKHDLVFPTATGQWLQIENWRNRGFRVACIEAGLTVRVYENGKVIEKPKYTPYSLRHFYASMLIRQKVDLKKIQRLMGHEKIETTFNTYGHLIEEVEDKSKKRPGMLERLGLNSCGETVA